MTFIFIFTGNLRITIYSQKTVSGGENRSEGYLDQLSYYIFFSLLNKWTVSSSLLSQESINIKQN